MPLYHLMVFWFFMPNLTYGQRPLFNHTANSLSHNGHALGQKLRNSGVIRDPIHLQTTQTTLLHPPASQLIFDDLQNLGSTRLPPGRRGNRRRDQVLYQQRPQNQQRPSTFDSLRKELMKPDLSSAYSSYSQVASVGNIGGVGVTGAGTSSRFSEINQLAPMYSTRIPPPSSVDNRPTRLRGRKNSSMNEIFNLAYNQRHQQDAERQSDDPANGASDDIIDGVYANPMKQIKERIMSAPYNAYEPQTELTQSSEMEDLLGVKCNFETPCAWKWNENLADGFQIITGTDLSKQNMTGVMPGPVADSKGDANGHFLYARLSSSTEQVNLTSPQFSTTMDKCQLEVYIHQSDMSHGLSRIVVEPLHSTESPWVPTELAGNNFRHWEHQVYRIGRITRDFRIAFEIVPRLSDSQRAHVAIDNLRMVNCFPEGTKSEKCSTSQVKCMMNKVPVCIPLPRICDINRDCDDAEDELQNCDKIPYGGRCDFESGWCGWRDSGKTVLAWSRYTGSSPTHDTGPDSDHTYQHLMNSTGYYMLVDMNQHINNSEKGSLIGFASNAIMISKTFNPPPLVHGDANSPYRNSCVVRFYIHQFGKNPGSINLSVVEMKEKENITTTLWWSTKNQGIDWLRSEYVLPNITSKYYLQFEARMGMRIFSDVAMDDFSLSPECFGLNIPKEYLNGYDYWDVRYNMKSPSHSDFEYKPYMELTTCNTRGMIGPTASQCEAFYKEHNKSHILKEVRVVEDQSTYKGMQKWKVPNEGHYTIIAKGASGGLGSGGVGSSRGAMAVSVLELHKNEELYILVGQQGENACIKSLTFKDEGCRSDSEINDDLSRYSFNSKAYMVKNIVIENGAGGGGGGSFVFLLNSAKNEAVPLIVAGGGGGLGIGRYIDEDFQHGQPPNPMRPGASGQIHGESINQRTAGPGGGWRAKEDTALSPRYGAPLLQGGRGGLSCYAEGQESRNGQVNTHGQGGFGGGGGGCNTGGGGGGYAGGDVYLNESNGEGGTSYINTARSLKGLNIIYEGANSGAGSVIIIPAIEGCGCDYRCIALDEFRAQTQCICPDGWHLKKDNSTACEMKADDRIPMHYLVTLFLVLIVMLGTALSSLILILYNRYQRQKQASIRHKMLMEQDLQLSRLRHTTDDPALPNFNPNYGCDGLLNGSVEVKSLPQVARESLRLVKALGQGAFGEVYQGLYRHRDGDAVEMPVAVKTLPEMSTGQAEADFLMEAAIMAKFNHANIVHLIGVCFDRHPRFIILELLAGGDLKIFLREGRNKPERPSPLIMKDLIYCALDVAKGCRYMESKRFIHRDIAARNCLLSSKGPGRVVKIADFGMARDIYRSDYYRKGGKAMLPIKWMPPEAFLDGIFTSKTDVWSFGVLLWEVFSLGLMPYTGLQNRDVMHLVTNGGRLDAPPGCPAIIYRLMAECWNPTPEERPSFSNILERLSICVQDEDMLNLPLPSIFRPPSAENDQTIMRPPGNDDFCLQVPHSSDYLIPLPGPRSITDRLLQETTGVTIIESMATCTPPVVTSPSAPVNADENGCWETSFIMPNSKSDQPLLSSSHDSKLSMNGMEEGSVVVNHNHNNHQLNSQSKSQSNNNIHRSSPQSTSTTTHNSNDDDDDGPKLISLDTPQPTPTTIKPPLSFTQLDGITLDPSTLTKGMQLNNSAATKQSYANIQMVNSVKSDVPPEKMNGSIVGSTPNNYDPNAMSNHSMNGSAAPPFTIQGFNDRYNLSKDNHSEISC
ncbi:tyrosine-protein kinase receptor [Episyrphus balteatus]|uniref:tyrosine-protein kinase receptor n=1 Tax=Episyrphus balteatus TaxID=286459 RepID=UPI0024859D39|nr:tyrosine-protein kinase receptor [Episyrphus balteatus]